MTASTPRSELSALAARNRLSQHTLTLIKDATLPNLARGQRLTDTQIGIVHEAVEVCLLSGLTEEQLPQAIEEHRRPRPPRLGGKLLARTARARQRERKPARAQPAATRRR